MERKGVGMSSKANNLFREWIKKVLHMQTAGPKLELFWKVF